MKLEVKLWNKYLLGFVFLLNYLNVISNRISVSKSVNWYTFTPEAPIAAMLNALVVFAILKYLLLKKSDILVPKIRWGKLSVQLLVGLCVFLLYSNLLSFVVAYVFDNLSRNFQPIGLVMSVNAGYITNYFLYAIIFMSYVFYLKNIQQEQHLKKVEYSLQQSVINNLRAQLNPHFLFNNLNSLDELIHADSGRASDFLADFANLYRFSLKNSNETLIPLEEELEFAQSYFDMMKQKYPNEYHLIMPKVAADEYWLPPFACQILIENAIEHNRPEKGEAISITITINNDYLTVKNNTVKTSRKSYESGRSLKNLKEQYDFLEADRLAIHQDDQFFTVNIPLLKND